MCGHPLPQASRCHLPTVDLFQPHITMGINRLVTMTVGRQSMPELTMEMNTPIVRLHNVSLGSGLRTSVTITENGLGTI